MFLRKVLAQETMEPYALTDTPPALTKQEIMDAAVLGELARETCKRLGIHYPPDVLLVIHRGVYARIKEHDLEEETFAAAPELIKGLEEISRHQLESEERWARHGRKTRGRWWKALVVLYESYYRGVYASLAVMIQVLESHDLQPPSAEELGLELTPHT